MRLESSEVAEMVGITPIYLNKFIERKHYGIKPSARWRKGRGGVRWFNADDVFGIALVWSLFESGLRRLVIERVLYDLAKTTEANAAAKVLRESRAEYLVIRREIRSAASKAKRPQQVASGASFRGVTEWLEKADKESLLVLPVGRLWAKLDLLLKACQ